MTKRVDTDLGDLALPLSLNDRLLVSRSNVLHRNDVADTRGGMSNRAPLNHPTVATFPAWLNQGSASLTDVGDAISLQGPSTLAGTNVVGVERPIPSTGRWDIQVGLRKHWRQKEYITGGIYLRDSASGKIDLFGFGHGNGDRGILASSFTDAVTFAGDRRGSNEYCDVLWFRLRQSSGPGYTAFCSPDGKIWMPFDVPYEGSNAFVPTITHWGIASQMTDRFPPSIAVRLDCFHWAEWLDADIYSFPHYDNDCGRFDRRSRIVVTTNASMFSGASISNLIDGTFNNSSSPFFAPSGQTGIHIDFEFPEPKIVTEAKWYQNTSSPHGMWKWQGLAAGGWDDISNAFELDGTAAGTVIGNLTGNTVSFSSYRLQQISGTVTDGPWLQEIEFKLVNG